MLGNLFGNARGGMSPITLALMGVLAYRTLKSKGRLADFLGSKPAGDGMPGADRGGNPVTPDPRSSGGGLGGLLGGLLGGGAAGGLVSSGLSDLLRQFQQNGQGDKAESWINQGPNKAVSSSELEHALGEERIVWLMQETGLSRQELLEGLSRELPQAVDQLTPKGQIPSAQ